MKRLGLALLLLLVSQLALADGGVIQPGTNTTCSGGGVAAACNNFGTFAVGNAATPPAIGGTTPAAGSFTTLGATGVITAAAGVVYNSSGTQPKISGFGNSTLLPAYASFSSNSEVSNWDEQASGGTITGTYANQRWTRFEQNSLSAGSAFSISGEATRLNIEGPTIANTNVTIVTDVALHVQAGASTANGGTVTTAVGLQVDAPTGGGTNKTAVLNGTGVFTPGLTTGTNADFICMAAGGQLLIQGSACTISSLRFKHDVKPLTGSALTEIAALEPVSFVMNGENRDANAMRLQIGLTAENVAAVDDRLAVYEEDGVTPKSYRQEAVLALAVAAIKEQQKEIAGLRKIAAAPANPSLLVSSHAEFTGSTPGISCGSGASVAGNDSVGRITVGSLPGSTCTLTFASAFANPPVCLAQDEVTALTLRPTTVTAAAVTFTGTLTLVLNDTIGYHCVGFY